jgi:hypothetical protein
MPQEGFTECVWIVVVAAAVVVVVVVVVVFFLHLLLCFSPLDHLHHTFCFNIPRYMQVLIVNNCNQQFTNGKKSDPEDDSKMSQIC